MFGSQPKITCHTKKGREEERNEGEEKEKRKDKVKKKWFDWEERKKDKKIFRWEIQLWELSDKNIKILVINTLKKLNDKVMNFSTYWML